MRTLVLGLGNPILRDDGVGIHVVRSLLPQLNGRRDVVVDEDYWGGLRLMERMIGFDRAIIIDAIVTQEVSPGTVLELKTGDIPTQRSASAHDVNLPTALELGRQAGAHLPRDEDIVLIGIEAEDIQTFDEGLSPVVEDAIPEVIDIVVRALSKEISNS
jgi:hydrogenase maturation protease